MTATSTASGPRAPVIRIRQAIELLEHRLQIHAPNKGRYRFQWTDGKSVPDYFQIAEKAPAGNTFQNGQNWKTFRGPTWKQMEIMESTSQTIDELTQRISDFIFLGKDTTRVATVQSPQADIADIERIVMERVQAVLANERALQRIEAGKQPEKAVQEAPPVPQGIRQPHVRRDFKTGREAEIRVVKERCKLLGIPEERIEYNGTGTIKRVWLRKFNERWEAAQNKPESGKTE